MFCTSLRRRPSYAGVIPSLISRSTLGLRENALDTHDIALPLSTNVDPRAGSPAVSRQLRVLLLSPSCVAEQHMSATLERVRCFAQSTATIEAAIVFLLSPPRDTKFQSAKQLTDLDGQEDGASDFIAYAKLQSELLDRKDTAAIPILPLSRIHGLPRLLQHHQDGLKTQQPSGQKPRPTVPRMDVLATCTADPPMQEQTAFILSDIFADLRELACVCTTFTTLSSSSVEVQKLQQLHALVGDQECRRIIDFWTGELAVE